MIEEEVIKRFLSLVALTYALLTVQSVFSVENDQGFVAKIPLTEWTAVASQKGWLQEAFAKQGATIELVDEGAVSSQKTAWKPRCWKPAACTSPAACNIPLFYTSSTA